MVIDRPIRPPLRRWAAARVVAREPRTAVDVLARVAEMDARSGDAAMAGLLDSAGALPPESRDALTELGCGWPSGTVRLRALKLLAESDEQAALRHAAVRAQADDLRAEIDEYEQLRSGAVSSFEASSLAELATLLVKARIARGWTQSQLASALGIAEQQVQRYESTGYRSASLARIGDVVAALDIDMSERAELRDPDAA